MRRPTNEDSHCARPDLGLFLVADGMGGHVAGEVASRVATDSIESFIEQTRNVNEQTTWPFPFEPDLSLDGNRIKAAFKLANRRIAAAMANERELRGMATTASAILIGSRGSVVAHVGDSRVYVLRAGDLNRLTHDHSWVEEQVRAGTMDAVSARQHPWRNVVTRALAGGEDPDIDIRDVTLEPGDRLLLCSDGLFSVVSDEQIGRLLGLDVDLAQVSQKLIDAANEAGGPDNITTLLVQIDAA
jgi:serine/threonine protein phosphatase PrpC